MQISHFLSRFLGFGPGLLSLGIFRFLYFSFLFSQSCPRVSLVPQCFVSAVVWFPCLFCQVSPGLSVYHFLFYFDSPSSHACHVLHPLSRQSDSIQLCSPRCFHSALIPYSAYIVCISLCSLSLPPSLSACLASSQFIPA